MPNVNQQIRQFFNLLKSNKKVAGSITGILYVAFRFMADQIEYNKNGWEQERIQHHADNVRCAEERISWKSQDSIRSQQIWDKAFNNARERILQPAIDSIRNL